MSEQETTTQQLTATETPEPGFAAAEPPLESSPTDQPQSLPTPESHQKKRNQTWAAALVALLLVIASSGITYFVMAQDEGVDAGEVSAPVAESPEVPSNDLVVPGEEPVADAAAVILPSVVQIQTGNGVGSGVIYDADGLILTAAHVVAGSETVIVRFEDGEEVEGNVLGGTSGADVAVIQVDRSGLPAADLALDQDPRVGQLAIAVGSPWGLQGTVTSGIISAVDQPVDGNAMLQTDAAINPGNSGGALVDREGSVIGINVSIFSMSGANDGVGFAVPIDVAADLADRVVNGESLGFAMLGVTGSDVESGQAGALISEVTTGSAADEAGVEAGDLVISIDGVPVQGIEDLAAQVRSHRPGTTVDVVLVRDGEQQTLTVTLDERPADLG
jgi:S1-C subfamily serine protease